MAGRGEWGAQDRGANEKGDQVSAEGAGPGGCYPGEETQVPGPSWGRGSNQTWEQARGRWGGDGEVGGGRGEGRGRGDGEEEEEGVGCFFSP